ncbi:MAG: helix-turn-helix domain-containing protein, partial [Desulfobulbaceae bacterium]|nr:helix-turn-helix domain-containing protein [Desulfobulbaceae bacterium]
MTNQQTDNETSHNNNLGDLLQRTRQARQKTLEDAAATTRINVKFLRALEENDFGKLPDEIFTRGFIKLYATYLGLDPVDTFKHYISQENLAPSKPVVKLQEDAVIGSELLDKTSVFIKKPNRTLPVTILLAILVIFYILGVFFKSEEQPSNSQLQPEPEITLSPVEPSPLSDTEPSPNQKKDPISKKIAKQPQQPAKPAVRKPAVKSASQAKQKIEPENIAAA